MLAARIEDKESRTTGLDAQLIGRYSTKAILPRVKSVYETAEGSVGLRHRGRLRCLFPTSGSGLRSQTFGAGAELLHDKCPAGGDKNASLG